MALGDVALAIFAGCWGRMFRYPNFDLRLDRGDTLRSDHGIVRGWIWGSTLASLHPYGGFAIEQEIERCEAEHYRCRHFFADSRLGGDGDGIIRLDCIHMAKIKSGTAHIPLLNC